METKDKLKTGCPKEFKDILNISIELATKLYKDTTRLSGDKYIDHCLDTAIRLQNQKFDYATVIAGVLHHVEITKENIEYINQNISPEVSHILQTLNEIDDVIKTTDSSYILTTKYVLNYVKDLRPVLIQLANAQSNSHTLSSIEDDEEKKKVVLRNFNIHSKLAEYLGFGEIQKDITEECFRITQKDEYEHIARLYKKENITTELLKTYSSYIKKLLQKFEKEIEIQSRIKSKHSTYLKSKKYIDEGSLHPMANIKDLIGIRILTKDKDTCYKILDEIWEQGEILLDEYEDYITHPKPNGYKAMQGPMIFPKIGKLPIEIQILSKDMYEYNTYGPASHITYKESQSRYAEASHKYDWIQETHHSIRNNQKDSPNKFSIPINVNIFSDKIYSLTPKGRIIALTRGNTVTDFAYLVHTDIGNSMVAAKINSRATSLDHIIRTGDVVEIVTQKGKTHPKPGLLKCAHSESTKAKITRAIK